MADVNHLEVTAPDASSALAIAARKMGCSPQELHITATNSSSRPHRFTVHKIQNNSDHTEKLLQKMEQQLQDIELDEIVSGYSEQELHEKGIVGQGSLHVEPTWLNFERTEQGICIAAKVDYFVDPHWRGIAEIDQSQLQTIPPVSPGTIIGRKKLATSFNKATPFNPQDHFDEGYLATCNCTLQARDQFVLFIAKVKGQVVVSSGILYVVPSDRDGQFSIDISKDAMEVTLRLTAAKGQGLPISTLAVSHELQRQKIVYGIDEKAITKSVDSCNTNQTSQASIVIARGRPPTPGKDATAEFTFDTTPKYEDFIILPDGRIDYHRRRKIPFVKKQEVLATLIPAQAGVEGETVLGSKISAPKGDEVTLYAGSNVSFDPEQKAFIATIDGQPALNKNILHVYHHFHVPADVDYSSGNISFDGNVTIHGNVRPGFSVEATGDIEIKKSIDCGNVSAGRDLIVSGGIISNATSSVKAGRNVTCQYMQNAKVEALGDISVGDSIIHSDIHSTGKVVLSNGKGKIVGGTVRARLSITAKVLGGDIGTPTEINAGNNFLIDKKRIEFKKAIDFCDTNIAKIQAILTPLVKALRQKAEIDPVQRQRLQQITRKLKSLQQHKSIMQARLKELSELELQSPPPFIEVSSKVYADVRIVLSRLVKKITEPYGPSVFHLSKKRKKIMRKH